MGQVSGRERQGTLALLERTRARKSREEPY